MKKNVNTSWFRYAAVALVILAIVITVVLGIRHANRQTSSANGKLKTVASFYPLYDFVKAVGGDKVDSTNVTPADAEPHDYEPTPQQLVSAEKADVLVYDGATMEPWVDKFIPDFKGTIIKASQGIVLKPGQNEDGTTSSGITDPHFWLDPVLAQTIINNIRDGLSRADPADSTYFADRAQSYNTQLEKLNKEFENGLATCKKRTLITSHAAFGYLGKRYNLDVVSIAGVSPEEEPSPAKLAELTRLIRQKGINYVFFETLVSPNLANTLAKETGAKTAVFDPIEGLSDADQQQGKDYLSVQRENLASLKTALQCQ